MGLLSKIFDTHKLSYILREDTDVFGGTDDDNTLMSKIGITKLRVGDRITPDMWDKQKIEDLNTFNFRIIYDEIIQDSYLIKDINSYEDYDDEAGWFVDLQDKNNNSWGIIGAPEELNFLNSILKPQYQIIEPINESTDTFGGEEDDTSLLSKIGVKRLGVGDTITRDMFKPDQVDWWMEDYDEKTIEAYTPDDDIVYMMDRLGTHTDGWIVKDVNKHLKDQYKIVPSLSEDMDTFGGEEDDSLLMSKISLKKLTIGSKITPNMWNIGTTSVNGFNFPENFRDIDLNGTYTIENIARDTVDGEPYVEISDGENLQTWDMTILNSVLKPQFQIFPPVTEGTDIFGGDEDDSTLMSKIGRKNLTIGDTITPDMVDTSESSDVIRRWFMEPSEITGVFENDISDWLVKLTDTETSIVIYLDYLNSILGPKYKITTYEDLRENDTFGGDDDDSTLMSKIGVTKLRIGDTITPNMWNHDKMDDYYELEMKKKSWHINDIERDGIIEIQDSKGKILFNSVKYLNTLLNPKYQIIFNLNEQDTFGGDEDDSSLLSKIGITRLTVGDRITHDMFTDDDFPFWKWEGTSFTISYYGNDGYKDYVKLDYKNQNNHKTSTLVYVDTMNDDVLEPGYKIIPPMTESLDTFGGEEDDSPLMSKIGRSKLSVGDTITPDMWSSRGYLDASTDALITDIGISDGIPYVTLEFPSGMADDWRLDIINKSLQSRHQVASPNGINESDDTFGGDEDDSVLMSKIAQYTGDVVLTFEIYMDGYLYLRDTDIEPFKKLNPNIDMDFDNDVIYANTTWKTSPVSIETIREFMQDEWGKELGPFTGPRTTSNFIHWLESTGEYSGEIIKSMYFTELKEINTEYWIDQDGEQFVKLTPEMEKLKDYYEETGGVKLLNVDFTNSLKESEDTFGGDEDDSSLLNKIGITKLGIGDKITPDMWNKNLPREYGQIETWIDNPKENQIIDYIVLDDYNKPIVVFSGQESDISNGYTLDNLNILLDPKYQIVYDLDESDTFGGDDDDTSLMSKIGIVKLGKRDKITPEMWDEKSVIAAGEEDEFLNGEIWTITDIVSRYMTLSSDGGGFIDWPIEDVQSLLKPKFQIFTSVNEQNIFGGDEDDTTLMSKIGLTRLTTGDTFTIGNNTYIIGDFDIDGRHIGVKKKGTNKELVFPITLLNSKLPPNTILVKPTPKLSELLN